jgi:DNA polymerase-1
MAKQSIEQRLRRIDSDFLKACFGKEPPDIRKRWEKVKEDLPDEAARIIAKYGDIPPATLDDAPLSVAVDYACRDADATLRIYPILKARLQEMGLEGVYEMDLAVVPMVERMCMVGMLVDTHHFIALDEHLTSLMAVERAAVHRLGGLEINPNSPVQVADLLFTRLKLKPRKKTPTGLDSTQDKVLEAMRNEHRVIPHIIKYREYGTYRDDFCLKMVRLLDDDGRIHPNLQLTRVSSGRLSCKEPNLLGIPVREEMGKLLRAGFVAGPGKCYGSWDLNQIEMREMAHQSEDPVLCARFDNDEDVHAATASDYLGKKICDVTPVERYAFKRVGFGVITGITEIGLAEQMALAGAEGWDEENCARAIAGYFGIYKRVKQYMENCRAEARRYGYVRDRWGRIRYLPGVHSELRWIRNEAERQSHSFKISASAQGILKHSMRAIWEYMKDDPRIQPLLQIHDELLFELDDDELFIEQTHQAMEYFMCNTTRLRVPIKAKGSTGANWGCLKD